jgi:hypothetical protein
LEGYKAQWNQKVYDFAQYVNKLWVYFPW